MSEAPPKAGRFAARLEALERIRRAATDVARHLAVMYSPDEPEALKRLAAIALRASSLPHLDAALEAERRLHR